jgi:hypothetical protein
MLQMTRFIIFWDVTMMPEDCSVLKISENTRPMREWNIPEDWNLQQPCHENNKPHKNNQCSY